MPAPETLTGVLRGKQGYLFISDTGRVFGADEPLGRLVAYASTRAARKTASGRSHFVAILDDELQVSRDGAAWQRAVAAQHDQLVDIVMSRSGWGLALSASGQLLATTSDGVEFRSLPSPAHRILRLARQGEKLLALSEHLGNQRYKYYELRGLELSEELEGLVATSLPLKHLASRPEHASLSTNSTWMAVREQTRSDGASAHWEVSVAPFGQPPSYQRLRSLDDHCWLLPEPFAKLSFLAECGANARQLRLVYRATHAEGFFALPLDGLSSKDLGDTYGDVLHRLSETSFLVALPCGAAGGPQLITTRPPGSARLVETPCREHQAFTRDEHELLSVARSPEGLTVHRWRHQRPEPVARLPAVSIPMALPTSPNEPDTPSPLPVTARATSITTAGKGIMLVVLRVASNEMLLRSDNGGATFAQVPLPASASARLRFVGRRGFLLDASARGFESNDAGQTWHRAEVPGPLQLQNLDCVAAGCLTSVGFRVGWDLP
jgi:photosystem II stability/assembly factor-like uncharacterized protein